jgi:hypothetical protein
MCHFVSSQVQCEIEVVGLKRQFQRKLKLPRSSGKSSVWAETYRLKLYTELDGIQNYLDEGVGNGKGAGKSTGRIIC